MLSDIPASCLLPRLLFQNLLMETDKAVLSTSATTLTSLLNAATASNVQAAVPPKLASTLFDLATIPTGQALPEQHILSFPMPGLEPEGGLMPDALQHSLGQEEGFDVAVMRLATAAALGQLAHKLSALGKSHAHCACLICFSGLPVDS